MRRFIYSALAAAAFLAVVAPAARAGYMVTFEAAGVQSSLAQNISTENFNEFSAGTYGSLNLQFGTGTTQAVATNVHIQNANEFGGAGGTSTFFSPQNTNGTSSLSVVTLTTAQSYFGFWWSAADASNEIDFYSGGVGGTLVAMFDPGPALASLTASGYFGNPNSDFLGQDGGEKFAYMNVYGTNGITFDTIVFHSNLFESDNFSISTNPGQTSGTPVGTPEPASLVLFGISAAACFGYRWRRRKTV